MKKITILLLSAILLCFSGCNSDNPSQADAKKAETQTEEKETQKQEEQKKDEEAAQKEKEQRKVEEAALKEEEQRKAEEAAQKEEEQRKAEEAAQKEEEQRKAQEAAQKEEAQRKAQEAALKEEEQRKAREAAQIEEEQRKAREAAQIEEEQRKAQEEAQKNESRRQEVIAYEKAKYGYSDSETNPSNSQYSCEYCGVSNVYLIRDGICAICYDEQVVPNLPKCEVCGSALDDNMQWTLGRCYNCMVCQYCGASLVDHCQDWTIGTIDGTWTCDNCYYIYSTPMCQKCGVNPQVDFSIGLCQSCMDEEMAGHYYCVSCGGELTKEQWDSGRRVCDACLSNEGY